MRKASVIFGTDGQSDYVQTPDGKRYSLGPVSVLTLVSGLVPSPRAIRAAMDEFLAKRQVKVNVNLEAMWKLLPVRKARFSSVESSKGKVTQMEDKWKVEQPKTLRQAAQVKTAADSNADLVESILRRVAEAGAEVQALEGKGYPVKVATLMKGELIRIASAVGELASGDLGSESTKTALTQLQVDLDKL